MKFFAFAFIAVILSTGALAADKALPTADVPGSKDPSYLGRFTGSTIISYSALDYDELNLPLGKLAPSPGGERDNHNNRVQVPAKQQRLEGRRTHILYLLPAGTSPLAAVRNYQNAAAAKGGKVLYECKDTECGGKQSLSSGGGSTQSLAMVLWRFEKITDKYGTSPYCAQTQDISSQHYTVLEIPASKVHFSVLAYTMKASADCKKYDQRTLVMLDVLETQAMAQTMETVKAADMVASITQSGRIALYGILFDSNKADVKPESKATMDEIAKLLTTNATMKLLVVGHTDNVGGFASNLDLSKKRADAVVKQLVSQYKIDAKRLQAFGVSHASPVASNDNEAGRAKNRRVELVAN